jgi:hypothetical protein
MNVSVGKSEGMGLLERPSCRWKINIKMGLIEIVRECVN